MNLFGFEISRKSGAMTLDELINRIEACFATASNVVVTPETCMESPTVHAIVTAISRRISVSPVSVYRKTTSKSGDAKEKLPNHPVAKLLNSPNDWQSRVNYWQDAASWFVRYGNFYAWKGRGLTGPIRKLLPLHPGGTDVTQNDDWSLVYRSTLAGGKSRDFTADEIHHVRGAARNGYKGDSFITDVREAIALEIAAERMGGSLFGNGAVPLMVFKQMVGSAGFKTLEDQKKFIEDFQEKFSQKKRFTAMMLPKGIEADKPVAVENDKAQFLETRKFQRTVIAGAAGVPPHLVGDLERATFNNVEQQDSDFTINVILPIAQTFESSMERDFLTVEDRNSGIIIRFNLDAIQRADFKSRQEGNRIMREGGALSPNEWRERESMNPISEEDGGDDYIRPMNFAVSGEDPPAPKPQPSAAPVTEGA